MRAVNKKNTLFSFRFYTFWMLLLVFFIASCAQITAPAGGKKDTDAPEIKASIPENFSTNFHKKQIFIRFNEWIQPLTNFKSQVIISPNIEPFPVINIARSEMSIRFTDTLQSNTTYSIYFGDNLKDNNEGNPMKDFKFLFSTGKFIDSLQVKGTVQSSLGNIPENTFLLLYKEKEDSVFTKKRPFYITKIQTDGSFSLENVKEGNYKIYALNDRNGNYYYDLPTEAIAFTDSLTSITSNIDSLNLVLFLPEDTTLRIFEFDKTIKGGMIQLTFNKELSLSKDELTATVLENNQIIPVIIQEKTPKKALIYLTKLEYDSSNMSLVLKNNGKLIDTLHLRTESRNFKNPIFFFTDTVSYKSLTVLETKPLQLNASFFSIEKPDTAKITITDTSGVLIPFSLTRDEDMHTYRFVATWNAGMKYHLTILDSALVDLAGNYNKTQEFSFLAISAKKSGNLLITYELPQKSPAYIAILKDNSGKVLDERILRDSQTVKINYGLLLAGSYLVEIIEDKNDDGIWNSGSFIKKELPEKIYKEPKFIMIKENWDAEETINVDFNKPTNFSKEQNTPTKQPNAKSGKGFQNLQERKGIFGE